jgi:hypothetical protein
MQATGEATNQDEGLFEDLPGPSAADLQRTQARAGKRSHAAPRILEPKRKQIELRASDLESLLPEDHRARLVWGYVERQELGALYEAIKARGDDQDFEGRLQRRGALRVIAGGPRRERRLVRYRHKRVEDHWPGRRGATSSLR